MINHLSTFYKDRIALSIGAVFASVGIVFGTWAAFIPFVKNKFGLDEAELGMLLLMLPLGAGSMNPLCVPMIRKLGPVRATLVSLLMVAVFLIVPINMPNVWFLGIMLFLYGMAFSAVNISMNTCASQLETYAGKNIIATCHGLWIGGAHPQQYVFGAAAFVILIGWQVKPTLQRLPEDTVASESNMKTSQAFIRPNKALWVLIIIGLCVNLGEGAMADWATVYVKEVMGTTAAVASLGFATYAFFMMTGRLLGDGLIANFGSKKVLRWCGMLMTAGYLVAVFAPVVPVLFGGLAMIGLGVSLGSPILYAASSKVPGLPKGGGLAVYNTYAMLGFLGGPVFIGFLAKAFSLPMAFGVVAFFAAVWVVQVRRLP